MKARKPPKQIKHAELWFDRTTARPFLVYPDGAMDTFVIWSSGPGWLSEFNGDVIIGRTWPTWAREGASQGFLEFITELK